MDEIRRKKRHIRIRHRISGAPKRPRVSIKRSALYVHVQLIDDVSGRTLAAVSGRDIKKAASKVEQAELTGKALAEAAQKLGVTEVVFDRSGYRYQGRIAAVARGLREGGLIVKRLGFYG